LRPRNPASLNRIVRRNQAAVILSDVIRDLRSYDEDEVSFQEPSIYVAEPWRSTSEAVVEWSMPKGGLPDTAAKRLLMYLISVRGALKVLGHEYDALVRDGRVDDLCALLVEHVNQAKAGRTS
jgi:hypothetical protein